MYFNKRHNLEINCLKVSPLRGEIAEKSHFQPTNCFKNTVDDIPNTVLTPIGAVCCGVATLLLILCARTDEIICNYSSISDIDFRPSPTAVYNYIRMHHPQWTR